MTVRLPALIASDAAPLPALYRQAKAALAECDRIDEIKDYADKAAALAAYAAQRDDQELEDQVKRIRSRAFIRMGELLQEIDPSKGGRPPETGAPGHHSLRKAAAAAAGLTEHQAKTAIRAANAPEVLKDRLDDPAATPPSVKQLARAGTKPSTHRRPQTNKKTANRDEQKARREWANWGRFEFMGADLWRLGMELRHGAGGAINGFVAHVRALDPTTKGPVLEGLDFLGRVDAGLKHDDEYPQSL
jgi:hypothetical protein